MIKIDSEPIRFIMIHSKSVYEIIRTHSRQSEKVLISFDANRLKFNLIQSESIPDF